MRKYRTVRFLIHAFCASMLAMKTNGVRKKVSWIWRLGLPAFRRDDEANQIKAFPPVRVVTARPQKPPLTPPPFPRFQASNGVLWQEESSGKDLNLERERPVGPFRLSVSAVVARDSHVACSFQGDFRRMENRAFCKTNPFSGSSIDSLNKLNINMLNAV